MCTAALAIAAVGVAASIGGTVYSAQQNAAYADAQNRAQKQKEAASAAARQAESDRQKGYERQSEAAFQEQLNAQSPQRYAEQQQTGTDQALQTTEAVRQQSNLEQGLLPGQTGSQVSDVFTKETARVGADRMEDAQKRITALARLSGYDRANGYSTSASNLYDADAQARAAQARRSLQLGVQEGQTATPWVGSPDTTMGAAASTLGNAALGFAGNQGAWTDLKSIFA